MCRKWQACLHLRARQVSGTNAAQLDFNAVQRGDAEMGQKAYRVVRACVESGAANPILSIHDQVRGHPREDARDADTARILESSTGTGIRVSPLRNA